MGTGEYGKCWSRRGVVSKCGEVLGEVSGEVNMREGGGECGETCQESVGGRCWKGVWGEV